MSRKSRSRRGEKKTYNTLRGVSVEAGSPLTIDRACEARNAGSALIYTLAVWQTKVQLIS